MIPVIFTARIVLPSEAWIAMILIFAALSTPKQMLQLKKSHIYYCQIQGQMAIGERPWCDFVVYTKKYMSNTYNLLPKLKSFYHDCVAPELVSPRHALGLPMRDLSKK